MDRCFTTPNGWTKTSVFAHWLRECLVPQLNDIREPGEPALLIFDGHSSHDSEEADKIAEENNIHFVRLPSHTTHKLQPLDVGLFGPMQAAWRKQCKEYTLKTLDVMPLAQVVREYLEARVRVMKESNIKSAWKKSGIRNLDPGTFSTGDYGPSQLTSTNTFLQSSYPQLASTEVDLDLESNTASDSSADTPWTSASGLDNEISPDTDLTDRSDSAPSPHPHSDSSVEPTLDQIASLDSDDSVQPAAGLPCFPGSHDDPVHTGDKGPNTHWAHCEHIERTGNMWLQYAQ